MEILDDTDTTAKISDSAYSNSGSNSQSRRSHSSKSTHSGSNSSGSSGYGGKPSTTGSSQPPENQSKERDPMKKKQPKTIVTVSKKFKETGSCPDSNQQNVEEMKPLETLALAVQTPAALITPKMQVLENMETDQEKAVSKVEVNQEALSSDQLCSSRQLNNMSADGFSCVISIHDGVVLYTTSMTSTIGFPKDMWIGKSFSDFVDPRDRGSLASQLSNKMMTLDIENGSSNALTTLYCRIRKYRNLGSTGFSVKDQKVSYMPFQLKLPFKAINTEKEKPKYMVIQATAFYSAFKVPCEVITKPTPFVIRHVANGSLEYIDPKSVPYLGYLPQDITNKCILQFYHPDDLVYLKQVYETILREGSVSRSKIYRMLTQNGDYLKLESEWSSFINPWSRKLEFVIGKHYVIEGPANPDVFMEPSRGKMNKQNISAKPCVQVIHNDIIQDLMEVLIKPVEKVKPQMSSHCLDIINFMESFMDDQDKNEDELRVEIQENDNSYFERDSVMLGGISPHHDSDSNSGTETPLSYNQLNYKDNLQRYFECHQPHTSEELAIIPEEKSYQGYKPPYSPCLSPVGENSGDFGDVTSMESGTLMMDTASVIDQEDFRPIKLTETLLHQHNADMEKELLKKHRETRSTKIVSNETRQKKREHLARCNASFYPTSAQLPAENEESGRKCPSEYDLIPSKRHCPMYRETNTKTDEEYQTKLTKVTTIEADWGISEVKDTNTYMTKISQMPIFTPVTAIPAAAIPIYYVSTATTISATFNNNNTQLKTPVPYVVYPHPVLASPFVDTTNDAEFSFPSTSQSITTAHTAVIAYNATIQSTTIINNNNSNENEKNKSGEETGDRTDGNSSYSSFYSSFFKTESGSAEDSVKNKFNSDCRFQQLESYTRNDDVDMKYPAEDSNNSRYNLHENSVFTKRKREPPWMDQMSLGSDAIYKYQVASKNMNDILQHDQKKITHMEQPNMVNEQLGQLYVDLQLEERTTRLNLEEGITSSSGSSGEETSAFCGVPKRKKEYSRLGMIYEEDAPLPSSDEILESHETSLIKSC